MEFGRILTDELDGIDFSLPAEPAFNKNILKHKSGNRILRWIE